VKITARIEGFDEKVRRINAGAVRAVEAPLRDRAEKIVREARDRWPVDSGRSRDGIETQVYATPSGLVLEFTGRAGYTTRVRDRGEPIGTSWRRLVQGPALSMGRAAAPEIVAALAAHVEAA
jgi:hypothetical protein